VLCLGSRISFAYQAQNSVLATGASSLETGTIKSVNLDLQSSGVAIEIMLSAPFLPQGVRLAGPDRLVFDFPGYESQVAGQRIPVNKGPVQQVRVSLFQAHPPVTRVVVDSKEPLNFEIKPVGNKVVIEVAFASVAAASEASSHPLPPAEKPRPSSAAVARDQPQPPITAPSAGSRVTAYELQARARTLKLENLQALEEKAQTGDPESETTLALAHHDAVLLKRDDAESLRLLHQAADQGFMAAEESLGIFAETGIGMAKPAPEEAIAWYEKAVQQGSLDAATNIALMYSGGIGVPKDPAKAMTWFRQAAEGGDPTAQYNLALMYARGNGIPRDYKEFVRWATAAADQNLVPALFDLASFYMHPLDGAPADVDRAIHFYERAANLGNARAPVILGNIFATGIQGKPDYEQAVKWYRKAADQGDPNAQFGLGVRYALGQGVAADMQKAQRLFTSAADQGQADAQYALATILEEGNGISTDPALAAHYYQLAAEQGVAKAQFRLGELLAANKDSRDDRVSACKWLMLAQSSIKESAPVLSDLRKSMTQQEIAEAEHKVDAWRTTHRQAQSQ
jgi:TPR repeat protein